METPSEANRGPDLGPRVELYTAPLSQVYAGYVVGALLILGGLGMSGCGVAQVPDLRQAQTPDAETQPTRRLIGGLIGGQVFILLGAGGIWLARSMVGTGIEICRNGIRQWPIGPDSVSVSWAGVKRFEEHFVRHEVPLRLGGPLLSETVRQVVVICRDGRIIGFDRETIAGVGRLTRRLREVAAEHSIAWVVNGEPD